MSKPLVFLSLLALSLLSPVARAGAPAVEGVETTISFGFGSWQADTSSESSDPDVTETLQRFRYVGREGIFHLGLRDRLPAGLTIAGDVSLAPAFILGRETLSLGAYEAPEHSPGDLGFHGAVAARVGWHFSLGGIELGPALVSLPTDDRRLMPSGLAWFGVPDVIYGWASIFEGPTSALTELAIIGGLGHQSDALRLEVGAFESTGRLRFGLPVKPGVWLGLDGGAAWQDTDGDPIDWRALMQVTIDHKRVGEGIY